MLTVISKCPLGISRSVFCGLVLRTPHWLRYTTLHKDEATTTVNVAEINHHANLRGQWWDLNGGVPFIRDGLVQVPPNRRSSTPLSGKKILDVGCGGGILAMPLVRLGADVTGIDPAKELIELANEHSEANPSPTGNKPTFVCTSIEEHASRHVNFYDGVVASEIIDHIDNDKKKFFVKFCVHALKPGGKIFFTAPTRTRISHLTSIFIAENILGMIPKGTHEYEKFITPKEMTWLLEKHGCHVELVVGTFYNPFVNKWRWVNSTTFCFALQAIKR